MHTFTIATFALCGFASFSSSSIQISGIPARWPRNNVANSPNSASAMLAGTMANLMSASIVGILS